MAQREPVLAQLILEVRPRRAGLDQRGAGRAVDLEHPVEPCEIERHRARVAVAHARLDAADDARPSAVRDHRGAPLAAPLEHLGNFARVAGKRDDVGHVVEAAAEGAHDVPVRLAVGVGRAFVRVGRADVRERAGRGQPRRRQLDLLERNGLLDVSVTETEVGTNPVGRRAQLLRRGLLVLVPPPPMATPAACGLRTADYQCTPRIRCANATPSAETSASFFFSPFAAELSGNSLYAVLRITSTDFGASA